MEPPFVTSDKDSHLFYRHSPGIVILILLGACIAGVLIGSLAGTGVGDMLGWEGLAVMSDDKNLNTPSDRNAFRVVNIISHLFTFTFPALFVAIYLFPRRWKKYLRVDRAPKLTDVLLGIAFILCIMPIVQLTYYYNQQINLPHWMQELERMAAEITEAMLVMDSPWETILTLLMVGVAAGLGEELVFRGILQRELNRWTKNTLVALWIAAIIFGIIHMQFAGLVPRILLGAILGYLYLWTRNLWVPIIAHFSVNSVQVLAAYYFSDLMDSLDPEVTGAPNYTAALISLVISAGLGWILYKNRDTSPLPELATDRHLDAPENILDA